MSAAVRRNVVMNVAGTALPALAGLIAMPGLVATLDSSRLGAFGLGFGLIGLAGLLDLGLGRGLTRMVADESGRGTPSREILALVRHIAQWLALAGALAGAVLVIGADWLSHILLHGNPVIVDEFAEGLRWIGLAFPFTLAANGLVGALEGQQRFGAVNVVRAPLNAAMFLAPLAVSLTTDHLGVLLGTLAAVRVLGLGIWVALLGRGLGSPLPAGGKSRLRALLRFSGWLTVSNVVGPAMVFGDRFWLAAVLPAASVSLYTVPFDAVTRASALPSAAANAVFPALTRHRAERTEDAGLIALASLGLSCLWFPPLFVAVVFAPELMCLWLGNAAPESVSILRYLLIGVFLNGLAHVPLAVLHAHGRSDLSARIHVLELIPYAALLIALVGWLGVTGAAIAWALRVSFDTSAICVAAMHVDSRRAHAYVSILATAFAAGVVLLLCAHLEDLALRATLAIALATSVLAIGAWTLQRIATGRASV